MKKLCRLLVCIVWAVIAAGLFYPSCVLASNVIDVENTSANPSQTNGQLCLSNDQDFVDANSGPTIVQTVFKYINQILINVATVFYTNIVGSTEYRQALNAAVMMYLVVYGALIMFNIANVRAYDVTVRLFKIAMVYAIMGGIPSATESTGFSFFYQWVGGPFIAGMNELIGMFIIFATGNAPTAAPVHIISASPGDTSPLNPASMTMLFDPMTAVFSAKFFTGLISLFFENGPSISVGVILLFALINFIFLLIGAIATYLKSIVGLAFLFGVAPIFIAFMLFEKTRQIFLGWLNQVVSFSLQPVMLFAFLAFYLVLITNALAVIANATSDYCYTKVMSLPGGSWDIYGWRAVVGNTVQAGDLINTSTGSPLPPSVNMIDACYVFLLCHLGYSFSKFIQQIAMTLTSGLGPGYSSPEAVQGQFKRMLGGMNPTAAMKNIFTRPGPS
jgi:type IV secretion system protein VirB6